MIAQFERNMNNLVKTMKPTVRREGRKVVECFFYERTGQCFGERCFWAQNGTCPFEKNVSKEEKV